MCLVVIFRKFVCYLLLCNKIYFLNFYYKFKKKGKMNLQKSVFNYISQIKQL